LEHVRRGPLAIPALVAVLAGAVPAFAGPDGPDIVQVVIAARQTGQATALRDNLFELFGRIDATAWYRDARSIDIDQLMKPSANVPAALAYVWIDLAVSHPDRVMVYLAGANRDHVLLRTVMLPGGLDEVAREEVSQIVASSVDTLRTGAPLAVAKAGDVMLSPQPELPAARPVWLTLGATGAAERWSDNQAMVPAIGISALLGKAGDRFEPALWLTVGYHAATTSGQSVDLQLRGGSAALVAMPGWRLGRWLALRGGLGLGLDVLSVKPRLGEGQVVVRLDPPYWARSPFARAALRADVDLGKSLLAFLAVTGDVSLNRMRYVVDHENGMPGAVAVYEPSRFRPSVLLGIEGRIMGGLP
jgi:hypothetical protein